MSRHLLCLSLILIASSSIANETRNTLAPKEMAEFNRAADVFLQLSGKDLRHLLDRRTVKGDIIFNLKGTENEGGLWATLDPVADKKEGTSIDKTHQAFPAPANAEKLIVAVLDNGVDIRHEDLKGKIWINRGEIANNGIDDDKNGYIDDVNGWNFLGGKKNGKNVNVINDTLEVTREFVRLRKKALASGLTNEELPYFSALQADYLEAVRRDNADFPNLNVLDLVATILEQNGLASSTVITKAVLAALNPPNLSNARAQNLAKAKAVILQLIEANPSRAVTTAALHHAYREAATALDSSYNQALHASDVIGDDPTQLQPVCATAFESEKSSCVVSGHGNNDVLGTDERGSVTAAHGTHVAGIIAAIRGNGIGIEGQAEHVLIMPVRIVPNGDEHDNHIAKAIRYAVDNGAKVINMSFGKAYSPGKAWIDAAVKYAESKGVMLVHAAGNSKLNTEEINRNRLSRKGNYPNKHVYNSNGDVIADAPNWLEVGASDEDRGENLAAYFTNHGKTSVDLFGPGMNITSTTPDDTYTNLQGTSMACPEVAGVVVTLMSLFPAAGPSVIYQALLQTVNKYDGLIVRTPGTRVLAPFENLSISGGTINSFAAATWLNTQKQYKASSQTPRN